MFKTSRVYARMIFVGDVLIIGGNHYTVTGIAQWPNTHEITSEQTRLEFHYDKNADRKIILIVPASEIFQIKHR